MPSTLRPSLLFASSSASRSDSDVSITTGGAPGSMMCRSMAFPLSLPVRTRVVSTCMIWAFFHRAVVLSSALPRAALNTRSLVRPWGYSPRLSEPGLLGRDVCLTTVRQCGAFLNNSAYTRRPVGLWRRMPMLRRQTAGPNTPTASPRTARKDRRARRELGWARPMEVHGLTGCRQPCNNLPDGTERICEKHGRCRVNAMRPLWNVRTRVSPAAQKDLGSPGRRMWLELVADRGDLVSDYGNPGHRSSGGVGAPT